MYFATFGIDVIGDGRTSCGDGFGEDGGGADIGALHDEGSDERGQDIDAQDAGRLGAEGARGLHHGLLAQAQHGGAHHADHARNLGDHESDDDIAHARLEERHEGQREEDGGDGHETVHDPHHDAVQATVVAGDETDEDAEGQAHRADDHAHEEGDAPPVERA